MAFVCISPAAILDDEVAGDESISKTVDDVRAQLNNVEFDGKDKLVLCLPGGGIVAPGIGRNPEMAVVGPFVAVLSGALQNYAYLVRKYCLEDLSLPSTISLEAIRERTPIREAALVCKLYERLGTGMLTKLRGKFAFALFDSSTMRVLAARDPSGEVPLVQGEMEGFVFLASGPSRPEGVKDVKDIEAGQFIYGWGSTAKKYANPLDEVEKTANQAVGAAAMALKGIKLKPDAGAKGRRSLDSLRRPSVDAPKSRRMSADGKGDVTPDIDGWKTKARRHRRSRRTSVESDKGASRRRSLDSSGGKSNDSKGSDKNDRKQRPRSSGGSRPNRSRRSGSEKVKAAKKNVTSAQGNGNGTGVTGPVHVAPVH
ncbi:hypothetical protein BSKO_11062 [Bryopsis sp. KO-2023]|nr:hypothetical protein BSKO_11062 [Bryopsis sp. KO-2023]